MMHRTGDEITFLKGLGYYSGAGRRLGRLGCLLGYKISIPKRTDWGEMDKSAIEAAIDEMISAEKTA